jgi:hypothetical protein
VALAVSGGLAANAAPGAVLTTNATTASQGGFVTVSSTGFLANEAVDVKLDAVALDSGNATAAGDFSLDVSIPDATTVGVHTLTATAVSGTSTATITVAAQPAVTPATASISATAFGTTGVTVTFSGFTPGDSVQFGGGTGGSGGSFAAAPVTVGAGGTVSYTTTYSDFATGAAVPGVYFVSAATANGAFSSAFATITVAADAATPVTGNAHFTG